MKDSFFSGKKYVKAFTVTLTQTKGQIFCHEMIKTEFSEKGILMFPSWNSLVKA